jgi:hypothetical protein
VHAANRRRPARPYLAVVLGAFSRKVIGLALEAHLQAELAVFWLDLLYRRAARNEIHESP